MTSHSFKSVRGMSRVPAGPALKRFRSDISDPSSDSLPRRGEFSGTTGKLLNILVVDDDPAIAELTAQILKGYGHQTQAVTTPDEAMHVVAAGSIDVVITDRQMPLMSGEAIVRAVKVLCPSTRAVLMGGEIDDVAPSKDVDFVLAKPFSPGSLKQAIAAATEAGAGSHR